MIPRLPRGFTHPMRIGEGAFASVYRVRQPSLDRFVAIKIIRERDRLRRRDLLREAHVQARIQLECIPHVYDAFEWNRCVCIVMEYIKGTPLDVLLRSQISAADRECLAEGFLTALAGLHALGFAHRDIKPANVVVSSDKGIHFIDFGFAKNAVDGQKSLLLTAKGTPAYMAPEIWEKGSNVDLIRADVYAAGRVLQQISDGDDGGVVKAMTCERPGERLASGREALAAWREAHQNDALDQGCWLRLAGRFASSLLAEQLVYAARQLLFAGRREEAYWLLAEAIEENPDQAEAIQLMGEFDRHGRKRRAPALMGVAAVLAIVAVSLAAFLAGRESGSPVTLADNRHSRNGSLIEMRTPEREDFNPAASVFKEDSAASDLLSGKIAVRDLSPRLTVFVDGKEVSHAAVADSGIALPYGTHHLLLVDEAGVTIRKERLRVLPFQTRIISAAQARRASPHGS